MKLTTWIVFLTVMLTFLSFVGFETSFSSTLSYVGINFVNETISSVDVENSTLYEKLFLSPDDEDDGLGIGEFLSALATFGAIGVGLYFSTKDTSILAIPFIIWVGVIFASSFWSIVTLVDAGWMRSIVGLIFGGLMVGFITSCMDYFLGR